MIRVEKSYGGIVSGTVSTLVREYLEPIMRVANTLGHMLRLIPYTNVVFEA